MPGLLVSFLITRHEADKNRIFCNRRVCNNDSCCEIVYQNRALKSGPVYCIQISYETLFHYVLLINIHVSTTISLLLLWRLTRFLKSSKHDRVRNKRKATVLNRGKSFFE